ncbi:uncharacterized protein DS421_3g86690 [Arachis hypogaea]|nr:uncharacterized protein DS421_3g86690 [Arachis hypogaea]
MYTTMLSADWSADGAMLEQLMSPAVTSALRKGKAKATQLQPVQDYSLLDIVAPDSPGDEGDIARIEQHGCTPTQPNIDCNKHLFPLVNGFRKDVIGRTSGTKKGCRFLWRLPGVNHADCWAP